MPDSRKKGSMTKQQRTLRRFTQLWLSANEWEAPVPILEDSSSTVSNPKIVAWTITRKKPS